MICISGMEGGSGSGSAASVKAGWLQRSGATTLVRQAAELAQAYMRQRMQMPAPAQPPAPLSQPPVGPDGRPLPPDGSIPPARPTPHKGSTASTRPGLPGPERDSNGRPRPPDGSVPPARPVTGPIGAGPAKPKPAQNATQQSSRPAGDDQLGPCGRPFVARPVPAPVGEFLFEVRCSCGVMAMARVTPDDLRRATAHAQPPSQAIAAAVRQALATVHQRGQAGSAHG